MEKIPEAYLDTSLFIPSILDTTASAEKARQIIDDIQNGKTFGYTATLTFDEIAYAVRRIAGFEKSLIAGSYFLKIRNLNFINVSYETVAFAQDLIKAYKLKPRDAIHAACAVSKGIKIIVSDDADFDSVKELERKSIKEFKI